MKKIAIILGTAFLFAAATVNAQTDSTKQPVTTTTVTTTETAKVYNDKYNNWSVDKYKMLPMPEALTTEKIFPTIGTYTVSSADPVTTTATTESTTTESATTSESAASSTVTITLDETSKGIVWVDGLPQGKFKAYLRKSPGTYMIPAQTVNEKEMAQGVLIYDKDANKLDVCIGCTYNNDDPASAFAAAPVEPVVEEPVVKTKKGVKSKAKTKAKPVVKTTWKYSGSKNMEAAATTVTPMQ